MQGSRHYSPDLFWWSNKYLFNRKTRRFEYMYGGGLETIFARDLAFAWTKL